MAAVGWYLLVCDCVAPECIIKMVIIELVLLFDTQSSAKELKSSEHQFVTFYTHKSKFFIYGKSNLRT